MLDMPLLSASFFDNNNSNTISDFRMKKSSSEFAGDQLPIEPAAVASGRDDREVLMSTEHNPEHTAGKRNEHDVQSGSGDSMLSSSDDEFDDDQEGDTKKDARSTGSNPKRIGFIETLYNMVHDSENAPAIGFAADGESLEIRNTNFFSQNVLPRYFKHRNVSSFIRQLNNYHFRTIPSAQGVFQTFVHDEFRLNRRDLSKRIRRRTTVVVKKKKTLLEQVTELKQRETELNQRIEALDLSNAQKGIYIGELEAHLRAVKEECDALANENQRLKMRFAGGGNSGESFHPQMYPGQAPPPPPAHAAQHQRRQHAHPSTQQWNQSRASGSSAYSSAQQQHASPGWSTATLPPTPSNQQHWQRSHQGLFEPVSGPSRYDPQQQMQTTDMAPPPTQQQYPGSSGLFEPPYDWRQQM